eukprot:m.27094 g.27094  ORF g.27094 m.27094 type:complete len:107 (+) comp11878_c0_seq2:1434-1754(+)
MWLDVPSSTAIVFTSVSMLLESPCDALRIELAILAVESKLSEGIRSSVSGLTDRDVVTFFFDRQRMWPSDVKHSLRGDTEPSRTHTNSPPHDFCQTSRCPLWDERA